jgi:NAD(P)H-hydrate epimerase
MITVEEMRRLEERAFAAGITVEELMEKAGKLSAEEIEKHLGTGNKVAVFVGPGNNGGDGLVAARYLSEKNDVTVIIVVDPKTDAAKKNLDKAEEAGVKFAESVPDADVIVDAMLGIGAKGALRGLVALTCTQVKWMNGFKVAIDVPTGVDAESGECDSDAIIADATICLHDCKEGVEKAGKETRGELWIVDIGLA